VILTWSPPQLLTIFPRRVTYSENVRLEPLTSAPDPLRAKVEESQAAAMVRIPQLVQHLATLIRHSRGMATLQTHDFPMEIKSHDLLAKPDR